ncbi:MAG: SagB/ThcOx family dehydrogenase [bacterium]|nr:SagB/ThcOx family dehydrogenase [bacterium]
MITRRRFLEGGLASLLAIDLLELAGFPPGEPDEPREAPEMNIKKVMADRRTVRQYLFTPIEPDQFRAILWAAQGVTDAGRGHRTVPSAGALYPLEVYAFTGEKTVLDLSAGIYRFVPGTGKPEKTGGQDSRAQLARACLSQMWVAQAPVSLVISAVYERTTVKYGRRGVRYADIEAGCAAQNVFLMAVSLGLAAGIVGAFEDEDVRRLTGAGEGSTPLLVMPLGYSA